MLKSELMLHLDMDTSRKDLYQALLDRGHNVTRTPNPEISQDASDEYHLLWATSHQRILFTFNVRDFTNLAKLHPHHSGILLANQKTSSISRLIHALNRVLSETSQEDWVGQVHWVSEWDE